MHLNRSFEYFNSATSPQIEDGHIFLKDLSRICQLSLETSFFTQMGRIFKQTRGSAIGNQISPFLANIAVSYKEQQWYDSYRNALEALRSQVYIIRYVDNRLVLYQWNSRE